MREKATLVLVDEEPTFLLQDGTVIDSDKIGYVAHTYGLSPEDCFYDKFNAYDITFIIENNVECEIEMVDEFTNPELYENVPLYEGERKPKLYKGKVIIHFK
jgi:hypothetical protein